MTYFLLRRLYPAVPDLFSPKDLHQVNPPTVSRVSGASIETMSRSFASKDDLPFSILNENLAEPVALRYRGLTGMESFQGVFRRWLLLTMEFLRPTPAPGPTHNPNHRGSRCARP